MGQINNWNSTFSFDGQDEINYTISGNNHYEPFLVNLEVSIQSKYDSITYLYDSILVGKGMFLNKLEIDISSLKKSSIDTLHKSIAVLSINNQEILYSKKDILPYQELNKPVSLDYIDSLISISGLDNKNAIFNIRSINDSLNDTTSLYHCRLYKDTTFFIKRFLLQPPLGNKLLLELRVDSKIVALESIRQQIEIQADSNNITQEESKVKVDGFLNIDHTSFLNRPEHTNTTQYPSTRITLGTSFDLNGVPLNLQASYIDNQIISPTFRNFIALEFDPIQYQNALREKEIANRNYTKSVHKKNLEDNKRTSANLDRLKTELNENPSKKDSLLNELNTVLKEDSLDEISIQDSSNLNTLNKQLDQRSAELDKRNSSLEESLKRLENLEDPLNETSKAPKNFLSSINKLQLGNFYERAGKFSIRDVEHFGINSKFQISQKSSVSLLYGKLNQFQSFNLEQVDNQFYTLSSAFNFEYSEALITGLRVTNYSSRKSELEFSNIERDYSVYSLYFKGHPTSKVGYDIEFNTSNNLKVINEENGQLNFSNLAINSELNFDISKFLTLSGGYERVGEQYRSHGVYFLIRDQQSYRVSSKWNFFKNKLFIKYDYLIRERYLSNETVAFQETRNYYELRTNLVRYPNIHIIHSPLTMEIANNLDTSFSSIGIESDITIYRLFFTKKVKRKYFSTSLLYNRIENTRLGNYDLNDGIQYNFSMQSPKSNYNFTTAFQGIFQKLRFISLSSSTEISEKLEASFYIAKNFESIWYDYNLRVLCSYLLKEKYRINFGLTQAIDKSRKPNSGLNIGIRYSF